MAVATGSASARWVCGWVRGGGRGWWCPGWGWVNPVVGGVKMGLYDLILFLFLTATVPHLIVLCPAAAPKYQNDIVLLLAVIRYTAASGRVHKKRCSIHS